MTKKRRAGIVPYQLIVNSTRRGPAVSVFTRSLGSSTAIHSSATIKLGKDSITSTLGST